MSDNNTENKPWKVKILYSIMIWLYEQLQQRTVFLETSSYEAGLSSTHSKQQFLENQRYYFIIINLTSIFFQDKSRVWTVASQQH